MNRVLPLLLLIVAITATLGYMALRPADSASESSDAAARQATDDDTPAVTTSDVEIAPVAPIGSTARGEIAQLWDVIPMTSVGQIIRDASITATHAGTARTGAGRTKWMDAAAGSWDLVVESEGNPTWRRTVTLIAGERTRTVARLGQELRIDGTVVDSFGDPVAGSTVYFLPRGTLHPTQANAKQTSALPASRTPQVAGYISATTSTTGKFRIDVPAAGAWRLSVGPPSAARWTQSKTSDLSHGGPDKVTVTIPSMAHVLFEFPGPIEDRPTLVRAYRFDANLAQQPDHNKLDNPVKKPGPEKGKGEQGDGSDEYANAAGDTYNPANGRAPGQLFDPGWVLYRTAKVASDGTAVMRDLPSTQEYRFLFMRQSERMVTAGPYWFSANKRSVAVVSLPSNGSIPSGTVDERASLKVGLENVEAQAAGVSWSF